MKVKFEDEIYQLVFTDHAKERMALRHISEEEVLLILKKGKKIQKEQPHQFWIYKNFAKRRDSHVCLSVSLENPFLIVITTLVNWRPV